jgi:predicted alpha/beta-fold hydrolase
VNSNWVDNDEFTPPWYLRSGHIQTLLTGFYKPKVSIAPDVTHIIPIGEFGEMLVHENRPHGKSPDGKGVFLLHGLGSCHRGTYMSRIADNLLRQGERVFRFDLPGAGDSYLHTPLPPHGACSELVWHALEWLSLHCNVQTWRGAGVSLGGNILLKLLATHAEELGRDDGFQIEKGVAVAPPIDLSECCRNMETGFRFIYAKYFLRSLKKQSLSRAKLWPQWAKRLERASFKTIREFDDTVTSVLAGFTSAEDYYTAGSSKNDLVKIRTQTRILVDKDDPIVPIHIFREVQTSQSTYIISTSNGGHVGYLARQQSAPLPADMQTRFTQTRFIRWADEWISRELAPES